jgi:integrase
MNLTAKEVATLALEKGETDRIWFDDAVPGFGVRVRESGSRSWIFQYKIGQKQRRLVIGQVAAIKPSRAREIAGEYHAKVKLGFDPAAEKRVRVERTAHTFGALAERYLAFQERELRPGSFREIVRHLRTHTKPVHDLPVDTVDQTTLDDLLDKIDKDSGAVTSNRVRATVSAMFAWGMRKGIALSNPVANTNKRGEQPRDRVLSDAELRLLWQALDATNGQYAAIIKLLMLTGQRVNEIAGLRWPEVNFDRNLISLPSSRTKNARPHDIPMSASVRDILKSQPQKDGRDYIFGRRSGPFSGLSRCKAALDKRIAELNGGKPLPAFVHHDLRRSTATGMADIGIQPHIIEAVLNHVSGHKGGIAGIYNRSQYGPEKVQALTRWADHINGLVSGKNSNITQLRGRA